MVIITQQIFYIMFTLESFIQLQLRHRMLLLRFFNQLRATLLRSCFQRLNSQSLVYPDIIILHFSFRDLEELKKEKSGSTIDKPKF